MKCNIVILFSRDGFFDMKCKIILDAKRIHVFGFDAEGIIGL